MANLFSELESLGLGRLKNMEVYSNDVPASKEKSSEAKKETVQIVESDLLFDKTYTCPVCDNQFKVKTVRAGKTKLSGADTDLRPRYTPIDSLKYDAIVCPKCGFAALNRFFTYVLPTQSRLIKENISASFKGLKDSGDIYSYDDAITRHKLALVNAIIKKGKLSEKAYTCLKIAWLIREKTETLDAGTKDYTGVVNTLKKEENEFIGKAYQGFADAFSKEHFPMCGMDEITTTYLVADLARRSGKFDEAYRFISKVIISRQTPERIKQKARDLKDLITADMKLAEEQAGK